MRKHTISVNLETGLATVEGIKGHACEEVEPVLDKLAERLGTVEDSGTTDDYDKRPDDRHQTVYTEVGK